MELVILAAGMGSRFGGLKQIEHIDEYGNYILDYSIYDAIEAGFDKVVFVIKEEMYEDFRNTVGKRIESKIVTKYAFQKLNDLPEGFECPKDRIKPWGTAHAILAARDVIEDNFIIINADDYYGKEAFKVAANYLKNLGENATGQYANIVYKVSNTMTENGSVKRAVCLEKDGFCNEMIESSIYKNDRGEIVAVPLDNPGKKIILDDNQAVSMNMFAFSNEIFEYLEKSFIEFLKENGKELTKEFFIPSFVFELINKEIMEVSVLETNAKWLGITYKEDKEDVVRELKKLHEEKVYEDKLWN